MLARLADAATVAGLAAGAGQATFGLTAAASGDPRDRRKVLAAIHPTPSVINAQALVIMGACSWSSARRDVGDVGDMPRLCVHASGAAVAHLEDGMRIAVIARRLGLRSRGVFCAAPSPVSAEAISGPAVMEPTSRERLALAE